jgi:hypothetical protein
MEAAIGAIFGILPINFLLVPLAAQRRAISASDFSAIALKSGFAGGAVNPHVAKFSIALL